MDKNHANNNRKRFSFINAIRGFRSARKPDVKKLIQNVLNWNTQRKLKELEQNKQLRFVSALLNAYMASSPIIDRFISWLLAVTGAIFILAFSNLANTVTVLPGWLVIVCAIGFLITAILGFLQKLIALNLHTSTEVGGCLERKLRQLQEDHTAQRKQLLKDGTTDNTANMEHEKDLEVFHASLKGVFGEEAAKKILTTFEKAISDPVSLMQSSYKLLKRQKLYALITVVCFSITVLGLIGGVIVSLVT